MGQHNRNCDNAKLHAASGIRQLLLSLARGRLFSCVGTVMTDLGRRPDEGLLFCRGKSNPMATTFRNLWPAFTNWDNLLEAYRRCRRRKRYKTVALRFDFRWESNLRQLQDELKSGKWQPGSYYNFRITDPKPRLISAAPFRDRIVHHAVVNILEPLFERRFIYDSYACRRKKGTHRAIQRSQYYLRRHSWYLKTDVVKFFPNIDHEILFSEIRRIICDERLLLLIQQILASGEGLLTSEAGPQWFPGDDLLSALRPCGLPIGNLTSQFFANVLLNPVDHFIKETIRIPGYVRYADDLLLFGDSKESLWETRDKLSDRLAMYRLKLHPHKTIVSRSDRGVNFLGFRVFPHQRRLNQTSIRRFSSRRRQWQWAASQGILHWPGVRVSLKAWLAHIDHANCTGIRAALIRRLKLRHRVEGDERREDH